jgi:predicted DNA-binding transcriptional regulator YafY
VYHPTTRVLTVLELLQSRRQMSGPELAARLEVDVRTVRRYVAMLQELGIPVQAGRGRYGAYRLRPGFKLPPLMFADDEALALVLGLVVARRLGLMEAAPAVEGALAKIERVLPELLRERVQSLQETLTLAVPREGVAPASGTLLALGAAIRRQRRVLLRYRSWEGDESERAFDPYGLVWRAGRLYVAGWCHLRGDIRTFRLDRVLAVEPREESFERPDDFDVLAVVERGIASVPQTWRVEVVLDATLEVARWRVPPALGTLEATPDGVLLRCWADDLDWAAHHLAGLGLPFTIVRPPELRAAVRRLAEQLLQATND